MKINSEILKISIQERIATFRTLLTIAIAITSSLIAFSVKNYSSNNLKLLVNYSNIGIIIAIISLLYLLKMLSYYTNKLERLAYELN